MDKKEGLPKWAHYSQIQVVLKAWKPFGFVMVPFMVISLMSLQEQDELMKRESNNMHSELALQKIWSH